MVRGMCGTNTREGIEVQRRVMNEEKRECRGAEVGEELRQERVY